MPKTTPWLWFDGTALDAARLYCSLFPNSRITSEVPTNDAMPDGEAETPIVVTWNLDGQDYAGLNGGPQFPQTEAFSIMVSCADQAEVDHYWDGLIADGGQESRCGWLKDRFGVSWQIVPTRLMELQSDPDRERAARATQAMLGMSRLVIADLEAAADGAPAHA
ncbi:VOC family protein [Angustibacter aerolatus]